MAFRSSSADLLGQVDEFLGGGQGGRPTVVLDIEPAPGGGVTLTAADVWPFPDNGGLFRQLVDVLNEYAARTDSAAVLHSGGVRTPDGRVLLLVGSADAGKSTLTAALVQAGCDYLGDEVIGIRNGTCAALGYPKPLSLDGRSRDLLHLPHIAHPHVSPRALRSEVKLVSGGGEPITEIVLPVYRFDQGAVTSTRLDTVDAVRALLNHTLNLGRAGEEGLQTICRLAEEVPVTRIEHDGAVALAAHLLEDGPPTPVGVRVRSQHPIDAFRPVRAGQVSMQPIPAEGSSCALLRSPTGPAVVVDSLGTQLWPLLDGQAAVPSLVESVGAVVGYEDDLWHLVIDQLKAMADRGLIDHPSAPWPISGTRPRLAGPWQDARAWLLAEPSRQVRLAERGKPWTSLEWVTRWWDRVNVATDSARLRRAFQSSLNSGAAVEVVESGHSLDAASSSLIELREVEGPGGGAVLRVGRQQLLWIPPGDEVATLALVLASLCESQSLLGSSAIAPTWVRDDGGKPVLYVGELPYRYRSRGSSDSGWTRRLGMRVRLGRELWIPDENRAVTWLAKGAVPDEVRTIWSVQDLVALGVSNSTCFLDAWSSAADALAPWGAVPADYLHHLVGDAEVLMLVGSASDVVAGLSSGSSNHRDRAAGPRLHASAPAARRQGERSSSKLKARLSRLGEVTVADESAKIDAARMVFGRQLLRVGLGEPDGSIAGSVELADALVGLGLERGHASCATKLASSAGGFYFSEERVGASAWRRKIYISDFTVADWAELASQWPSELSAHTDPPPSWVAWKFSSHTPGVAERAIDVPFLGGAPTIGTAAEPTLARMPPAWSDAVRAVMDRMGVRTEDPPHESDAITVEEGGRFSVDIAVRGTPVSRGAVPDELRWIAAIAGHEGEAVDALVEWAADLYLANFIFGTDRNDSPFVNVYVSERPR